MGEIVPDNGRRRQVKYLNKIIQGDCLEVMKAMPDNSIDLTVTSPPYNVGIDYGDAVDDDKDYEDYLDWLDKVWDECYRLTKEGGRICINVSDTGRNPYYPVHCDITSRIRKKWYMMGIIIWYKQNCLSNTAWGSWMSASSPHLRGLHEFIIVAGKGGKFFKKDKEDDDWQKDEFLECTLEVWNMSPAPRTHKHPTPFPKMLPTRCIKLYSYLGDVVLDPFAGSGTTALAAQYLNRNYIGIELSAKYAKIANDRLAQQHLGI